MTPSLAERDELFRGFARALFRSDIDALYEVVTPDFLWSFHNGLALTKSLADPDVIRTRRKAGDQRRLSKADHILIALTAGARSCLTIANTSMAPGCWRI